MSILVDETLRVAVQGITGREGSFQTERCIEYGTKVVAGVTPGRGGETALGVPVFNTVRQAVHETGANCSLIFVPAAFAADAVLEAAEAGVPVVVCATEGIPAMDMVKVKRRLQGSDIRLVGPNCPGIITPGECKIGIMPGNIFSTGSVGVVSRSGTLTYEAVFQTNKSGIGQTTAVGIGGEPVKGTEFIDVWEMFRAEDDTKSIIMIGEIGGPQEVDAARWAQENMSKPIVGFVAGVSAPTGRRMGHAGAIISGEADTANAKMDLMEELGVHVVRNPALIGETAHRVFS